MNEVDSSNGRRDVTKGKPLFERWGEWPERPIAKPDPNAPQPLEEFERERKAFGI